MFIRNLTGSHYQSHLHQHALLGEQQHRLLETSFCPGFRGFAAAAIANANAASAESAAAVAPSALPGLFELRTYIAKPGALAGYLQMCADTASVRRAVNPGFLGMWVCETGADVNGGEKELSELSGKDYKSYAPNYSTRAPVFSRE